MNGNDRSPDPFEWLWMTGLVVGGGWMVWQVVGVDLVALSLRLKQAELDLLHDLGAGDTASQALADVVREALSEPAQVSVAHWIDLLDQVGRWWRWPVVIGLIAVGAWLLVGHPAERFRRRFDLRGLAEAMGEQWPYALHALRRGNIHLPLDHPRWGMALAEWAFVERFDLLVDPAAEPPELHLERTRMTLARQLGEPWRGVESLPLHAQALAGLFARRCVAFVTADERVAADLDREAVVGLRELAWRAAQQKANDYRPTAADYRRVIQGTRPDLDHPAVQAIIGQHRYTHTMLMRLLEEARRGGVLPPALFTWLKGVDRPLWYALTSLGRRAPFVEGLGASAHYVAERRLGRALQSPAVAGAVEALATALTRAVRPAPPEAAALADRP
jgi:intracellular multiplication protein IcmP